MTDDKLRVIAIVRERLKGFDANNCVIVRFNAFETRLMASLHK